MKRPDYKQKYPLIEMAGVAGVVVLMIALSLFVHPKGPIKVANPVDQLHLDKRTSRIAVPMGAQIVAGESVGRIYLKQPNKLLEQFLGKPTAEDAAMCKSWERWKWKKDHVVEVFKECDADKDMKKTVRQIRISGLPFKTKEDVSPSSKVGTIQKYYRGLVPEATFTQKSSGKQMIILDQIEQGIAFVVDAKNGRINLRGRCHMIIVHIPGEKAINTYLRPEWKLHAVK